MLYDANLAANVAERMLKLGVYVISFSYPVVPKEKARIRTQISAAHSKDELDLCCGMLCKSKRRSDFNDPDLF